MLLILFLQAVWEGVVYHSKKKLPKAEKYNAPAFFFSKGILDGKVGFLRFFAKLSKHFNLFLPTTKGIQPLHGMAIMS